MHIAAAMPNRSRGSNAPALALLALLAGCATGSARDPAPAVEIAVGGTEWLDVVAPEDADRLAHIDQAWAEGLAHARRAGFGRALASEGALLDPRAALPRAMPPPGPYHCRIVRLSGFGHGRALRGFRPWFCHVVHEGALLSLTKQGGTERPGGFLWEDGRDRMIFIGAMALGGEDMPPAYGEDAERDLIGRFERVGAFRWRLAFVGSIPGRLDLLELVPAPPPE